MYERVALVGLPGSGKSAVGRCLADRLGRPFVDLDDLVERRSGHPPARLIDTQGEAEFRREESAALAEACRMPGVIIATGGGSVVDPLTRWALWEAATVIRLDATDPDLISRLAHDPVERPLLRGDAARALHGLRTAREPFYRAADATIDASGALSDVAALVEQKLWPMGTGRTDHTATQTPQVRPARRLFDALVHRGHPIGPTHARIVLGRDLNAADLRGIIGERSTGMPIVVADERVTEALPGTLAALPSERLLTVRGGEAGKRLRDVGRLLEAAAAFGAERGDAWVCVGGGTITDLGGTAAALFHRGAPLIHVPTTWLAQADAALGGKVAVNLMRAKNAVGAFWPPISVVADVVTLRTLPRARLLDGMAESLKCALIGDPTLWRLIETRGLAALGVGDVTDEPARYAIIERSARLKLGMVERDPYEAGERRVLNLGHTLGHALEVESRYRLPHGQAVVLGIRAVAAIAEGRGAEPDLAERIDALASTLGFRLRRRFDPSRVRQALAGDKKRRLGRQRWILPLAVGQITEVDDVSDAELDRALARIAATPGKELRVRDRSVQVLTS